jgi:hypothetical protein
MAHAGGTVEDLDRSADKLRVDDLEDLDRSADKLRVDDLEDLARSADKLRVDDLEDLARSADKPPPNPSRRGDTATTSTPWNHPDTARGRAKSIE